MSLLTFVPRSRSAVIAATLTLLLHEIRAWSSRDGRNWVKGGVWTLPAGSDVKVGLVSHGGAGATARFDYFRLFH